jgi:thymidine kinase
MPELKFLYSSMNSGKSLTILTKNFMLKEKGFNVVIMKPSTDTRTHGTIATRLGIETECMVFDKSEMPSHHILKSSIAKPDFILIDEAQFMTKEQVWDCANLVDHWNMNVYCYGLRVDWTGNFFEGSEELFKISDTLEPIENFCKHNKGALAYFHIKNGGSNDSVEVGAEDLYDTVSRKTWKQWWDKR